MTDDPLDTEAGEADWPTNYFNYFTEIEEHFRRARGTGLFLLSPIDWALIENWKNSGIPLAAVLRGIDEAFAARRNKKRYRTVNSIAYCAQAVMKVFRRLPDSSRRDSNTLADAPFAAEELESYLQKAAQLLNKRPEPGFQDLARGLETLAGKAAEQLNNLEELERHLTAMEDKMVAIIRSLQTDEDLYTMRESLDADLKPYRGKMTADQLAMLERRYLDSAILDRAQLPRLSLFYLR